ncbi:hypothetical protein [Sulfurirhabdus autotrophica]|nr:hypothetical protein [Sulfurirhabdus autotrophica]
MIFILLFGYVFLVSPAKAVDIIINSSIQVNSLSRGTARAIFGMRLLKWPDGRPIKVFVMEDASLSHIAFCKEVLDIYPYQLRQSWDRLVYSGTGQAPISVSSEDEMIAMVASNPGAIGYLRRSIVNDRIRTIPLH